MFEGSLSGNNAVILGFFENGNGAEVGISEENAVLAAWVRETEALVGKDRAYDGSDHGVAHAHDVDTRDALADVGMDAFEVVEDGFFPVVPVLFEKELALLRGR